MPLIENMPLSMIYPTQNNNKRQKENRDETDIKH